MSGFTKLVPEIVQSSLWNEPAEIRCVWIAMIATKDDAGYVRGDARTIARVANVSLKSATAALAMFQEPDPSSHTPDNEGRRIMPAPGGWIVLNHAIYRARDDVYREKNRARVRKFRSKMEGHEEHVTLHETLGKRDLSASASVSASSESVLGEEGSGGKGSDFGDDGWAQDYVVEVAASPDVGVVPAMAREFHNFYSGQGWVNNGGHPVARTLAQLKSKLRWWKTRQASMGKTMPPEARPREPTCPTCESPASLCRCAELSEEEKNEMRRVIEYCKRNP